MNLPPNPPWLAAALFEGLQRQLPVENLPGVSIKDVRDQPENGFDFSFELRSGSNRLRVLAEAKTKISQRSLEQIAPWIKRVQALRPDMAVAIVAPMISPPAQAYCIQNGLNFLDLAGNLFIDVPGKFTIQRTGRRRPSDADSVPVESESLNVFSGRSSRILRVLLEKPRSWTLSEIGRELAEESTRFQTTVKKTPLDFQISLGSISKALASLEEQLLIRRRRAEIFVPEPKRLLQQWAEKYRERYRWRLRSSFETGNPFGSTLSEIARGIDPLWNAPCLFTGAIAASDAPFIDIDRVDIFLPQKADSSSLRGLKQQPSQGPKLRFIVAYDDGVFLYCRGVQQALLASPIQVYLDLYARGGRDQKQADYLLERVLEPQWRKV